jgi:hypothetical protein
MLTDCELALERHQLESDGRSGTEERQEKRDDRAEELSDWKQDLANAVADVLCSFHASRIAENPDQDNFR